MPGGSKYMRYPNNGLGVPQEVSCHTDTNATHLPPSQCCIMIMPLGTFAHASVLRHLSAQVCRIPSYFK